MKILVTGGAGFIGSHLILRLLDKGHDIICVDNMNPYYDPKLKETRLRLFNNKVKFYQVNIANKEELEKIFQENKIDKICHLAAQAGVRYSLENPFVYGESNLVGIINLLEFARQYRIKHIVLASSSSVYGLNKKIPFNEDHRVDTPISIYSASKRAGELLAHAYSHLFNIDITCLRPFTVYGPYGRPDMALFKFTKNILEGKPIDVYNNGDMERDFTYVTDIVDGFVRALNKPMGFAIFNLGAGNPVKLMDFIRTIEEYLGKKAIINFMPMQPGDVKTTFADISKAQELLGYQPKVNVKEGVKNFVDWYLSEVHHAN
ncbi:MAG: GDP-mannose 4,6-dehydratase [Nanoarchaeota archaeon]|nr:GDP-mannose 4,6-dehydratase [Nanoarchaeota archaeon]